MNELSQAVKAAANPSEDQQPSSEEHITALKQAKQYYHGHGAEMNHEMCIQIIGEAVDNLVQENSCDRVRDKLSKLDSFLREITSDDTTIPLVQDLHKEAAEISAQITAYLNKDAEAEIEVEPVSNQANCD